MHLAPRFINDFFIENQIISYVTCYFSIRQILYECTSVLAIIVQLFMHMLPFNSSCIKKYLKKYALSSIIYKNDFFIENQIISYLICYFSMRQIFYECTSVVDIIVLVLVKGEDVSTLST